MLTGGNATAGPREPGSGAPSDHYACSMGARFTACAGLAAAATLLLGGCGSDDDGTADDTTSPTVTSSESSPTTSTPPSETTTPAPAGTPECADVWKAGAQLPRAYKGCAADGLLVAPDGLGCSSGQTLVRYDDRFWAVRGGTVLGGDVALTKSKEYKDEVATCRG